MRIFFEDDERQRVTDDSSYMPNRWGPDIIKAYRKNPDIKKKPWMNET
ncbi:hypothetical protein [Corynebacterium macginleyi]|nr:hypothetical protein [Corynebacterium macginleyi]